MNRKPKQYAIASCTREATSVGIEIAASGGNAVDAAVGVAYALIVSNILMCSIGGGGFATVRTPDGEVETIDFFDAMPGKGLNPQYFQKYANPQKAYLDYGVGVEVMLGHSTVGVPGTVKGLELLHKRHGKIPFKEVLQPAIEHARKGIKLSNTIAYWLSLSSEKLHWYTRTAKKILSTPAGNVLEPGHVLKQPDLANTLELIANYGSDVVYKGIIADAIVQEMKNGGGLITFEDLENYEAIVRKPLYTKYRSRHIWTNPPPSVGGATLVEILNIISHLEFKDQLSPQSAVLVGKAIRQALFDKYNKYVDINTNEDVSKELLSPEYALECYKKIVPCPNTTHLSCVDNSGCACGITMSMGYGSGVAVPETGIIMDNSLGELELNPQGFLKAEPGTRLMSGMTPTIMFDDISEDLVVLGTPGATRIAPTIAQIILNLVDFKMDLLTALSSPRFHYEDKKLSYEPGIEIDKTLLDPETIINPFDDIDMYFGGAQCARFKKGKLPEAATDRRRSGSAQTLIA
ncbi:MAG: gamma-glutamyltransferase [Cyanobacteriota bacterium]